MVAQRTDMVRIAIINEKVDPVSISGKHLVSYGRATLGLLNGRLGIKVALVVAVDLVE